MSIQTDTDRRISRMMAQKTPAERLRMASRMFDTARTLVLAGASGPQADVRALMLVRFYSADLSAEELALILAHLGHNRSGHGY
jgi:hypothetical protein